MDRLDAMTTSMTWLRMPGETWGAGAASFLGTWIVMMAAMMLPSLVPMLWRYREALTGTDERRLGALTALSGIAYLLPWVLLGMVAFALGTALAVVPMGSSPLAHAVPYASGVLVLIAGGFQFTAWKAHHLACFREAPGRGRRLSPDTASAWRYGLHLALHCTCCNVGYMVVLFVFGIMDLGAMAIVTAAITAERLAPNAERAARVIGAIIIAAGLVLIVQTAGRA